MCKASTPDYVAPPKYARAREPDNAALYEEAADQAAMRGGGRKRSTILTGLRGMNPTPMFGMANMKQPATALG